MKYTRYNENLIKKYSKPGFSLLERTDIQAILTRGYSRMKAARYILLEITNTNLFKDYIEAIKGYITPTDIARKEIEFQKDELYPNKALNIAFTGNGLKEIGLDEKVLNRFSREFVEGMSYVDYQTKSNERAVLLGDLGNNRQDRWHWGDSSTPVHCLLMVFAAKQNILNEFTDTIFTNYSANGGFRETYIGETYDAGFSLGKEQFGFQDGISQPGIAGLSTAYTKMGRDRQLFSPGEFILGYENEYKSFASRPFAETSNYKKDLGKNGSYLVFRQIEQYVEKFWKFMYQNSNEAGVSTTEKAVSLAAKMVGRWPNGQPLVMDPEGKCREQDKKLNDFNYAQSDPLGIACPFGAHIRRMNPRDQTHTGRGDEDSNEMSRKHRMVRRGRIYGEPLDSEMNIDEMIRKANSLEYDTNSIESNMEKKVQIKRGLHFICIVSDIQRQFEFLQSVWGNTSTFAELHSEVDPLISPRPTSNQPFSNDFTCPQTVLRNRYTNVPEFTAVVGGAYFFVPGLNALDYILNPSEENLLKLPEYEEQ